MGKKMLGNIIGTTTVIPVAVGVVKGVKKF